jgi:O-antigen ligase
LIVLGSAVLALAIVDPRFRLLLVPPLALTGLWAVGRFQLAAACAVVALAATIFEPSALKVPVGPLDLRLSEIVLGALLVVALVRPRRNWWGGAAGMALAVFFVVLGVAAALAVETGRAHPVDAYHYSRSLAPVLLFYAIVRLFPARAQVYRLLVAAAVMAALTGLVSVLAASPGSPVNDFLDPSGATAGDPPPASERTGMGLVNRVRLPGVAMAYVLFWFAAVRAMRSEKMQRLAWLGVVGGMGIGLALSFNRNMWIGLTLGMVMVFALTHSRARRQIAAGLLMLVLVGTLVALSGVRVNTDSPVYPIVARFTTIFQPETEVQDSSLTDRFYENRYAIETIRENPLIGVGPGAPYGLTAVSNLGNRVFLRENALFAHNQYLHLLLIGGPLALLSFLSFLLAPILAGRRRLRDDDVFLALSVGVAITMVSALVMLSFIDATFATVLGLVVGALAVLASQAPAVAPTPDRLAAE